jgi:hypothetical protein
MIWWRLKERSIELCPLLAGMLGQCSDQRSRAAICPTCCRARASTLIKKQATRPYPLLASRLRGELRSSGGRLGIQNWRAASTTAGMPRHAARAKEDARQDQRNGTG